MIKHHLIRRTLTGGVVIAAAMFPFSAQAGMFHGPPVCQGVCQLKGHMYVDPGWTALIRPAGGPSAQRRSQSGFHWDDAGIGAAGAAVLLGGGAAAVAMTRRRRIQRTVVG